MLIHANLILTSVEDLFRLITELKLSKLMMNWKNQDKIISEHIALAEKEERKAREKMMSVYEKVKTSILEIDQHLNVSRSKRSKLGNEDIH